MNHACTIAGREVDLAWTQESAKRFAFRMGEIGGEPTGKQLSNPKTVTTALFKVLWGLLPSAEFARHSDPEALFVAVDHETEGPAIYQAIKAVYEDRFDDPEKKSTLTKSPSPESNSD
jgi:hypothetical protein